MAYANYVDTVVRSKTALIEAFSVLEKSAKKIGLKINRENMKFMLAAPKILGRKSPDLTPLKFL